MRENSLTTLGNGGHTGLCSETQGSRRVCDFSDAALNLFAANCDDLRSGWEALAWMLESKRGGELAHKDSFVWLHEEIGQRLAAFTSWLPRSSATLPASEVAECTKGKGPFSGLLRSIGTALAFVELWGAEAHPLRIVLRGMQAAADRIDCAFINRVSEREEVPAQVFCLYGFALGPTLPWLVWHPQFSNSWGALSLPNAGVEPFVKARGPVKANGIEISRPDQLEAA